MQGPIISGVLINVLPCLAGSFVVGSRLTAIFRSPRLPLQATPTRLASIDRNLSFVKSMRLSSRVCVCVCVGGQSVPADRPDLVSFVHPDTQGR